MISCTLESLPTWNSQKVLSKRCESLRKSSFQVSKSALQVWKKSYVAGASFCAFPHGSPSSFASVTTGKSLRTFCSASQERLWGVQRVLLEGGDPKLKDGFNASSRSLGGSHFLELDRRKFNFWRTSGKKGTKSDSKRLSIIRRSKVNDDSDNEYCDRSPDQPHGTCSFRQSSSPSTVESTQYVEVPEGADPDQSGYTIKVSRELMGVFRYVEKVKRARIKDLADTLKQTAGACMFFSCVRGILGPLVEVFQTNPPSWGRLILMLSAVDSFAITYLALKAAEPLEKLSMLASESEKDIMGSIEKEEEHMLALAVELVKLFKRLRNITVITAVAQFASLLHTLLQLNNPKFVAHATKIVSAWFHIPWN
ncbi:unnamed protein product [Calypogeia fissa]